MIRIDDIGEIPELNWSEYCGKEFTLVDDLQRKTMEKQAYVLKLVSYNNEVLLVMGAMRHSLIGQPFIWVLLTKGFEDARPGAIRRVVQAANAVIPKGDTAINEASPRSVRLAKTFGFRPTSSQFVHGDTVYRMYRRG